MIELKTKQLIVFNVCARYKNVGLSNSFIYFKMFINMSLVFSINKKAALIPQSCFLNYL